MSSDRTSDMSRYDADPEGALEKYVQEKIDLTKRQSGKLKSAAGFLRQAIRKNYQNPEAAQEAQLSEQRRKIKERARLQRRLDNLAYERDKLDQEKDVARAHLQSAGAGNTRAA